MPTTSRRYYNFNPARQPANGVINYPFFKKITPIVADSITVVVGTPSGGVSDIQTESDGNDYNVAEVSATPGINFIIYFQDVLFFNFVRVCGAYVGSTSHTMIIQLYNFVNASYETRREMVHFPNYNLSAGNDIKGVYEFKVEDCVKYISGGEVRLRIAHPQAGNPAHDIHIEYASLY